MGKAFVSGASSGLGRELALGLKGVDVYVIQGRDERELNNTRELILTQQPEAKVFVVLADLSDLNSTKSLVQRIETLNIDFDKVILNAGGGDFGFFKDQGIEKLISCINLNIVSNTVLLHHFLTRPTRQKPIDVLVISSHAAFMRIPRFAVYASSKTYLLQLCKALNLEMSDNSDARITVACPGAMESKFGRRANIPLMLSTPAHPGEIAKIIIEQWPRKRVIIPAIMDRLIYWLTPFIPERLFDRSVFKLQTKFVDRGVKNA